MKEITIPQREIERYKRHGIVQLELIKVMPSLKENCSIDLTPLNEIDEVYTSWMYRSPDLPRILIASQNVRFDNLFERKSVGKQHMSEIPSHLEITLGRVGRHHYIPSRADMQVVYKSR